VLVVLLRTLVATKVVLCADFLLLGDTIGFYFEQACMVGANVAKVDSRGGTSSNM
jgi:hypothetical protein